MPSQSAGARESGDNRKQRGALSFLRQSQIHMIDEALTDVGEFGEVRLIVTKGRLRFVVTQHSHDALQWEEEARNGVRRTDPSSLTSSSAASTSGS
ncbi:MAG: hypothetical protein BMS9Abin28_0803 [Anaerolineae bacterium]|nr:MAG: hypothetical protein BMS9Abin28_0803 [Anaerolineae bacterium]